jgi:hypothetical protein
VCQPLGLRRTGMVLLYLVMAYPRGRAGRQRLLRWGLGDGPADAVPRPGKPSPVIPVDGWTACAAALKAEADRDPAQADRLVRGLLHLPPASKVPRTVSRIGFDILALAAARRRDWPAVLQRASLGRGRGCRFQRLVARAHLTGDVPAPWLWIAWLLAPRRREGFALAREAARSRGTALEPRAEEVASTPWVLHLRLLDRSARGEGIPRAAVFALATAWEGPLGPAGQQGLHARARELGAIDPTDAAGAIAGAVLDDLEALAGVAEGPWPSCADDHGGLPQRLVSAAEDRLHAALEPWVAPYRNGDKTDIAHPLEEWARWLALRAALDRLEDALGRDGLVTAWYGGLRLAAWNWPCRLLETHQEGAAWSCHVMFQWTATLAERVGDEEAAQVNRKNTEAAANLLPP